ncbi:N-6 DNA methylase [Streptomyces ureilyticus]|uniref:SAM-dependent DNA methyltransferase n=1 Tax=Streptomyces ureilyticus TaxID=1775131 RepID=A0ABX0DJB2_9ACTN|nr:N-6 DNA methylase [Streptomyces ureilyticus]NGO41937.1 SAM-dependent DNA methyltransferase [Streptomyces ureilyticus]
MAEATSRTGPAPYAPVTLGEIKELAGVGRPTVSNWRRRFSRAALASAKDRRPPFPEPIGGSESKPLFDALEIADWLSLRPVPDTEPDGSGKVPTYGDRFRQGLKLRRLVTLKHHLGSTETLIAQALATLAMWGEGENLLPEYLPEGLREDYTAAGPEVRQAVSSLRYEIGSLGRAADAILGIDEDLELAKRLESDLVMDTVPREIVALVASLIGPNEGGPDQRSTISLCAGLGELLLGMDGGPTGRLRGHGELVAVEPDPLRRKLLAYRLLSHEMFTDVCPSPSDLDTPRWWGGAPGAEPWTFSTADIVLASPPYASGERERDEKGPLWWAQEAVRRLNPDGHAYAVVPTWTLTRTRGAAPAPTVDAREQLLAQGSVEAIVQLPRRIHPFRTGAEYALLVLRPPTYEASDQQVLLIDADRIAQRAGGRKWIGEVAQLVLAEGEPDPRDARSVSLRSSYPGGEQLLDSRSVLPAHRIVTAETGVDHFEETVTARRAAMAAMPQLRDWLAAMGIAKRRTPVRHRKLDQHVTAGQLKSLGGHRIKDADIGEAGLPVIGREEMAGELPVGQRRISPEALAAYSSAKITERGDVIVLAEQGVRCQVDEAGGCVLLSPVQGLRIAGYREFLVAVAKGEPVGPDALWMRPHALAQLLQSPRNQHRGSGSLVRRVSVRDMDLPQLSPEEIAELEAILTETERLRADVRRQLAALDHLAARIAAGVADGDLALRRR